MTTLLRLCHIQCEQIAKERHEHWEQLRLDQQQQDEQDRNIREREQQRKKVIRGHYRGKKQTNNISNCDSSKIPFALLALAIFILFVLIPILTLAFYPLCLCQRCLSVFPHRWQIALYYFVDAFQGCYKDGTEPGSKDCRWFSVSH